MTANPEAEVGKPSFMDKLLNAVERIGNKVPHPVLMFFYLIIGVIVLSAILALCILGFYQMFASLTRIQIALGVAYSAILYLRSGEFSLLAPEDQLVYRRAGESRTADAEQVP